MHAKMCMALIHVQIKSVFNLFSSASVQVECALHFWFSDLCSERRLSKQEF